MSFILVDTSHHPRLSYCARVFNEQEGYRFTYAIRDKMFIETATYLHWNDSQIVDIAFDLSCMSGCAYKCKFCASSRYNKGCLTASEIVQQVETTLAHLKYAQEDFLLKCRKFTFSFEGMGEPSLPNVSKNILSAISMLQKKYLPEQQIEIQFIISTIGAHPSTIKNWADQNLPLETLQLSLHAVSDSKRRQIIGEEVPDINEIFEALSYFRNKCSNTLIKVNYLLMKVEDQTNYSNQELEALLSLLKNTNYWLKISHLNNTASSKKNGIKGVWGKEAKQCYEYLKQGYENIYEYGSTDNLGISCGQLASYAEHIDVQDKQTQGRINEIFEEITERNVILFVGAGVSRTLWDADKLAKELFNDLGIEETPYSTELGLQGVADIYYARNRLDKLFNKLDNTIKTQEPPTEFIELTRYPWRAIYTTNYDDFIERAYGLSQTLGQTPYSYNKISKLSDFDKKASPQGIPIIKLHGCIHDGIGAQVISSPDYLQLFWDDSRQALLKRLETDILQHAIVFAGYSLNDPHISRILYHANKVKNNVKVKGYFVSLKKDVAWEDAYEKNLLDKFNLGLVKCTFEDFLTELSRIRRRLKIFISGSIKQIIPGLDRKKEDVTGWANGFLSNLGKRLGEENICVRTGATATDKAGYIVAKHMSSKNIKTYIWYGADRKEYGNEVSEMINRETYGMTPIDVVDKITRECNVAVFLGGSGLSLEEMYVAISRNILVIPIKLKDSSYASSILHSYLLNNVKAIEYFSFDQSAAAKRRGNRLSSRYLTKQRLEKLDMEISNPTEAVGIVMEIIRHFQIEEA